MTYCLIVASEYDVFFVVSVCIYGGGSRRDQINICEKGVEIVVATPGRLNDLIMNEIIDITTVSYLVKSILYLQIKLTELKHFC